MAVYSVVIMEGMKTFKSEEEMNKYLVLSDQVARATSSGSMAIF